jgi:hypothetical protein
MHQETHFTVCPGCGLQLPASHQAIDERIGASAECLALCHELSFYTLARGDAFFIHQVAVDAYAAQHAHETSKPITVAFALIGLYLVVEEKRTGKDAQRAHMRFAKLTKEWPRFDPPTQRGTEIVADVLKAPPGSERDAALMHWAQSVWTAWQKDHESIRGLVRKLETQSSSF